MVLRHYFPVEKREVTVCWDTKLSTRSLSDKPMRVAPHPERLSEGAISVVRSTHTIVMSRRRVRVNTTTFRHKILVPQHSAHADGAFGQARRHIQPNLVVRDLLVIPCDLRLDAEVGVLTCICAAFTLLTLVGALSLACTSFQLLLATRVLCGFSVGGVMNSTVVLFTEIAASTDLVSFSFWRSHPRR